MNYGVRSDPDAFRRLRSDWQKADEPQDALTAFERIETILSHDAQIQGESRTGELRILVVPPLGVIFHARPDIQEVLIVDAWLIRSRKP